jgi:hypothetical protein
VRRVTDAAGIEHGQMRQFLERFFQFHPGAIHGRDCVFFGIHKSTLIQPDNWRDSK